MGSAPAFSRRCPSRAVSCAGRCQHRAGSANHYADSAGHCSDSAEVLRGFRGSTARAPRKHCAVSAKHCLVACRSSLGFHRTLGVCRRRTARAPRESCPARKEALRCSRDIRSCFARLRGLRRRAAWVSAGEHSSSTEAPGGGRRRTARAPRESCLIRQRRCGVAGELRALRRSVPWSSVEDHSSSAKHVVAVEINRSSTARVVPDSTEALRLLRSAETLPGVREDPLNACVASAETPFRDRRRSLRSTRWLLNITSRPSPPPSPRGRGSLVARVGTATYLAPSDAPSRGRRVDGGQP